MKEIGMVAVLVAFAVTSAVGQQPGQAVRPFISVDAPVVALVGVRVVDGTGGPARPDQTVLIRDGRIAAVGPSSSVTVPSGAQRIDLSGHTVIPGLIGLHDHMYYSSVMGSMKPMQFSYPRLFLGAGVTTIRTTGSVDPYQELNLKRAIDAGEVAGPEVFVTGPYLQGQGGSIGAMHPLDGPEDARRMVRYWAEEGVSWFKAYTTISRAELGAAIDEAHRNGVKVTAHLCSVGFREAVGLGIDNLEHGLLVNTEYWNAKRPDQCPSVPSQDMYGDVDLQSESVQQTFRDMIDNGVAMTSTLAVMELSQADRVPLDQRVLETVAPEIRDALVRWKSTQGETSDPRLRAVFRKAMDYERAFVDAGGLLAAGSDPCCLMAIAGFADQRNFELLIEAGFSTTQAVRIMSANGARVLGIDERVGTIQPGMQADIVVLAGDLTADPATIRNVVTVFRKGIGYDSAKLIDSVRGLVGIR